MDRGRKGETGERRLSAFLTLKANAVVAPIHAKALPVLLTTPEEWRVWPEAPPEEAKTLQRPLPDDALTPAFARWRPAGPILRPFPTFSTRQVVAG